METNDGTSCPKVDAVFGLLAKKWAGLILFSLCGRELFFRDLEKAIPALSARVLTQRMRDLEAAKLVVRTVRLSPPLRVSYHLSDKGESLAAIIQEIAVWAKAQADLPIREGHAYGRH